MISIKYLGISILAAAAALLTGCGESGFNYGKVGNLIQGSPTRVDAEYVMMTQPQVDCGVQNDLWDPPAGNRARLTQKGRDLKFADDVIVGEMKSPYAQIRGDFTLVAMDILADRDGPEPQTKMVDVRIGVPISNSCFPQPLAMMGVRKGNFTQDYPPVLLFRYNGGWTFDKFVH